MLTTGTTMNARTAISYLVLIIYCASLNADNIKSSDILSIDKPAISVSDLYFPDSQDIQPDKSDFKILSTLLLSSKSGKRVATITLKNLSSGQRILTNKQILAVFANGQKKAPLTFKQTFSGNQKISLSLNFGISNYPILDVYTNN